MIIFSHMKKKIEEKINKFEMCLHDLIDLQLLGWFIPIYGGQRILSWWQDSYKSGN